MLLRVILSGRETAWSAPTFAGRDPRIGAAWGFVGSVDELSGHHRGKGPSGTGSTEIFFTDVDSDAPRASPLRGNSNAHHQTKEKTDEIYRAHL